MWVIWSLAISLLRPVEGTPNPPKCEEAWCTLQKKRKTAYRAGNFRGALQLCDREAEALRRTPLGDRIGASPCDPLEVGFIICSERRPEFGCANEYLDRFVEYGCRDDPAYTAMYYKNEALLRRRRMDFRGALESLERMAESAEARLGSDNAAQEDDALVDLVISASQQVEMAALLRSPDVMWASLDEMETLLELVDNRSLEVIAEAQNLAAWGILLAREAEVSGAPTADMATDLLLSALTVHVDELRPDGSKADNVRINLALVALQDSDPQRAQVWLDGIDARHLSAEERLWLWVVQVRIAQAHGSEVNSDAWQQHIESIAAAGRVPMAAWYAAETRGRSFEVQGRWSAAINAYTDAEAVLESSAQQRTDAVLAARGDLMFGTTTRRLVGLLLARGEVDAAARIARQARSRAPRMAAGKTCPEARRPRTGGPAPGELQLLYFRASATDGRTQWVGFAITSDSVRAEPLVVPTIPPAMHHLSDKALVPWSDALLLPFRAEVEASTSIVILSTESLHEVPMHALPWGDDDGILLDVATVQYGLDLTTCGNAADEAPRTAALVIGQDPAFGREIEFVTKALKDDGLVVDHLRSTDSSAFAPWAGYSWVHFLAHGSAEGEPFASDDVLKFSSNFSLTRREILEATNVPHLVYLSACRASFVDSETLGGRVSLAHAFLLQGTQHVVAPVDDLDGEVATDFATAFYKELAGGDLAEVPEAWQTAYLLSRRQMSSSSLQPYLRMLRLYSR